MVRALWHRLPGSVRAAGSFLGNWAVAVIGTAAAEYDFKYIYRPRTFAGLYLEEILLSAVCASLLGWFVFYKWKPAAAKWIWTFGACFLAWRSGVRLAPGYVPDWDPIFNEGVRMIYAAMAVRTIAYSLGAWLRFKMTVGEEAAREAVNEII